MSRLTNFFFVGGGPKPMKAIVYSFLVHWLGTCSAELCAHLPNLPVLSSREISMMGPSLNGGRQGVSMRMGNVGTTSRSDDVELLRKKGFREGDRVVLYDGVCNMCNGWVNLVLDRDKKAQFRFAALQGDSGRALMRKMGRNPDDLSTLVLLESDCKVYTKSEAVLRVLSNLGGITGVLAELTRRVIPCALRDFVYADIVAPNRYKLFGKTESEKCRRMTAAIRNRFLD